MNNSKVGQLLKTNKFAIFLEIVIIICPFWIGLIISDNIGVNHIPLGDNLKIIG